MKIIMTICVVIGLAVFGLLFPEVGKVNGFVKYIVDRPLAEKKPFLIISTTNKKLPKSGVQGFKATSANSVDNNNSREVSISLEERYQLITKNTLYPTLSSRLSAINARRPGANYSPVDVLLALEKPTAWKERSQPGPKLSELTLEDLNDGRRFVDFDPLKVETLMVGDNLKMGVDPFGQVFDMRVDDVHIFNDGNVQWKGAITNVNGGTVAITQSHNFTIASVVLPEDDYRLEAYGTDGWIIDGGTLSKVNSNKIDVITSEK